jgi:PAS domain S-box-containing protein
MNRNPGQWLIIAVVLILVAGTALTLFSVSTEERNLRVRLLTETRLAAEGVPVGEVDTLSGSETDDASPQYAILKTRMAGIRAAEPLSRFAYIMKQRPDGTVIFLVDSEPADSPDYSPPGQVYPEASDTIRQVFATGEEEMEGPIADRWGTWVSGLVPLTDPGSGKVIGVFGMDIDAADWNGRLIGAALPPVLATLVFLLLVITFFIIQQRNEQEKRLLAASADSLRESEERYRILAENSPDMIYLIDTNGKILFVNPVAAAPLGRKPEAVVGHSISELFPGPAAERHMQAISKVIGEGVEIRDEISEPFPGGDRWIDVHIVPVRDRSGAIIAALGISTDITERRRTEEALRMNEERYRLLFTRSPLGVVQIDQNGFIIAVNEKFAEMMGAPPDRLIGFDSVTMIRDPQLLDAIRETLDGNMAHFEGEYTSVLSGRQLTLRMISQPLSREKGEASGAIALFEDISDRKQMEEAIRGVNRKLNLLSSVTRHDILNRITTLRGYQELLRMELSDRALLDLLEQQMTAAEAIERQISFTREYQNLGVEAPGWQDVHIQIVRAKSHFSFHAISCINDISGLELYADPMLVKVFENLIDNALRYGGTISRISFSFYLRGDDLVLTCEDDGMGIPEDEKNLIFERGYGKNTGLGLFLVHEILGITGLSIRETGEPGRGARFEILVPAGKFRFTTGHTGS